MIWYETAFVTEWSHWTVSLCTLRAGPDQELSGTSCWLGTKCQWSMVTRASNEGFRRLCEDVKLGHRRNYNKGWAAIRHYAQRHSRDLLRDCETLCNLRKPSFEALIPRPQHRRQGTHGDMWRVVLTLAVNCSLNLQMQHVEWSRIRSLSAPASWQYLCRESCVVPQID